jgi:hypothetical protein
MLLDALTINRAEKAEVLPPADVSLSLLSLCIESLFFHASQ